MKQTYIPIIGRLIVAILVLKNGRAKPDYRYNKTPYWKRDLTAWQVFKVNFRTAWRRFDVQTRGMGLVLVLMMGLFVVINVLGWVGNIIINSIYLQPHAEQMKTACLDREFYIPYFKQCEDLGVRPSYYANANQTGSR